MCCLKVIVFSALIAVVRGERRFPDAFKFGAATASYQVEGAWNVSDKSASIWDTFSHNNPSAIVDQSNGDVACDSYHKWREDIDLASQLGLDFYRLSLSWPRLLPNGFSNYISEDGKRYYNDVINGLLEKGIEPVITLYHWDLPQKLQDLGGWANPLIVEWFSDYARVAYDLFGDRIKSWITINEGIVACEATYTMGSFAPGVYSPGFGSYLCNKNVLLAHAKAWRLYDEEYKPKYGGKVSLTNQIIWAQAHSEEYEDLTALVLQMNAGLYSHPIFSKEGGWPPSVEKYIAEKSAREGYTRSRLPPFTTEEIDFVKGTFDFYALNYYTGRLIRSPKDGEKIGEWPLYGCEEINAFMEPAPVWPPTSSDWFFEYPEGLRLLLSWLKKNYGDLEYRIMENGYASDKRDLNDIDRVNYYKTHLEQVYLAITEDNVNVTYYTAWTLLDNFEWVDGYVSKFGLIDVDFTNPARPRTPRSSAYYYANVISTRSLYDDDLKTNPGT
ncbi:myrosinase 1 [Pieris rapae]|uniref:myrosinase 1 n=1 Tax=Pieris rapae TaxID=64459 RepID=UPI001E280132|nr:myrosinase 1 [Pieris rapae]